MKTKLNLLITLFISLGLKAQNPKIMEDKCNVNGQVVKQGKVIFTEIVINASPERVWHEFTNFSNYPNWNPFIKYLRGTPVVGNKIEAFLQPEGNKGMVFKP